MSEHLTSWLAEKEAAGIRPTTLLSYRSHVDRFLIPALGHLLLRDLRGFHVQAMLRQVATGNADRIRGVGPTSQRRIIATLSSALASAKRQRLVSHNVAADVELRRAARTRVDPWSPEQLGRFLDHVSTDRLGPVFEVLASTGMRRGEVLGMRWSDVDLDRGRIVVRQQLLSVAGKPRFGPPKTASGDTRRSTSTPARSGCCSPYGSPRMQRGPPGAERTTITAWSSPARTARRSTQAS